MAEDRKEEGAQITFKNTVVHTAGKKYKLESLTAAKTLDVHDSGKVFMLNLAGGFTVTLPSATGADVAGVHYKFIVGTAPTTAYIVKGGTDDLIAGHVNSSTGGDADSDQAADQINFVASTATIGDRVDIWCDGTRYHANCFCDADAGITLTG